MQLKHFKAKAVHGFLKFCIEFNQDVTFLTGINGSGKTSAVQSIIALISPSLLTLANLQFERMQVDLLDDDGELTIWATRDDNAVTVGTSRTAESFLIPPYIPDPDEPSYRGIEREQQFYLDLTTTRAPHPVIELITSLPTPMFLDLDRRARFQTETEQRRVGWVRIARRARNIFNMTLTDSLLHATALAENRYRELMTRLGRIGEESRRDMVLSLLTMNPEAFGAFAVPTAIDRANVQTLRETIKILPNILQISVEEVNRRVLPFIERLETVIGQIPADLDSQQILSNRTVRKEELSLLQHVMWWGGNQDNVRKFSDILRTIEEYNSQREHESAEINQYLTTINGFLNDSRKTLRFDNAQNLIYSVRDVPDDRQITTLSSGEAQIFVILTHLFFNPAAQRANVFIIDEPELSLHVEWQELFLDSLRKANPRVQYILSTHSPSIILERLNKCVDLTKMNM